jgi:hypothetical protein
MDDNSNNSSYQYFQQDGGIPTTAIISHKDCNPSPFSKYKWFREKHWLN